MKEDNVQNVYSMQCLEEDQNYIVKLFQLILCFSKTQTLSADED